MKTWKKILLVIVGFIVALVLAGSVLAFKVYNDVSKSADKTYETVERTKESDVVTRDKQLDLSKQEAMSVLLLGVDTGDLGRTEQGRSDTIMVATVNPLDNKTTLVSIARDTYVDIVGRGTQDKINHAYAFGGVGMSMDTVSKFLDIPIDHYVMVNMAGLKELVNAVGGIEVNNSFEFTQNDYTFKKGNITLMGDQALPYSRMRHEDPRGDYGRQDRQRQVVTAVAKKLLSINSVTKYQQILDTMSTNVKTDIKFDQMKTLMMDYRGAFGNIQNDQLMGDGFMQDGISYQRVNEVELNRVKDELKSELNISK